MNFERDEPILNRRLGRLEDAVDEQKEAIQTLAAGYQSAIKTLNECVSIITAQSVLDDFLVGQVLVGAMPHMDGDTLQQAAVLLSARAEVMRRWQQDRADREATAETMKKYIGKAPTSADKRIIGMRKRQRPGAAEEEVVPGQKYLGKDIPITNEQAGDQAGTALLSAVLSGRRRVMVLVDQPSMNGVTEAVDTHKVALFVELMLLPLAGTLENLKAEQNRCRVVFDSKDSLRSAKKAFTVYNNAAVVALATLDNPRVDVRDRLVVIVGPIPAERREELDEVLELAEDSTIVLLNPGQDVLKADPEQFKVYEKVYDLKLMAVQYVVSAPATDSEEGAAPAKDSEEEDTSETSETAETEGSAQALAAVPIQKEQKALGALLRQFPGDWELYVQLHQKQECLLAGSWEEQPPSHAVKKSLMSHIQKNWRRPADG